MGLIVIDADRPVQAEFSMTWIIEHLQVFCSRRKFSTSDLICLNNRFHLPRTTCLESKLQTYFLCRSCTDSDFLLFIPQGFRLSGMFREKMLIEFQSTWYPILEHHYNIFCVLNTWIQGSKFDCTSSQTKWYIYFSRWIYTWVIDETWLWDSWNRRHKRKHCSHRQKERNTPSRDIQLNRMILQFFKERNITDKSPNFQSSSGKSSARRLKTYQLKIRTIFCSITLLEELKCHSIHHDSKVLNTFHTTRELDIQLSCSSALHVLWTATSL